ncbi:MAG: hypothetical protein WAN72_06075, partial [Candidatus Acidiferrales bacterium]
LSAAVMNPPPGPADEIKMQMKEKERESRFVRLQNPGDEFAVHLFVAKQDFYGFSPRPVDFFLADGFVAVAEVETNKSNELSEIVLGSGLSQIRNGHGSLLLIQTEHCAVETSADTHARESPFTVLSLFRPVEGAENSKNRLRSFRESHRH